VIIKEAGVGIDDYIKSLIFSINQTHYRNESIFFNLQ